MKKIIYTFVFLFALIDYVYSQAETRWVLLPNSNILVCGGRHTDTSLNDDCYIVYPDEYGVSITTAIYYYSNMLSTSRYAHTMTLLPDGRVLVVGGFNNGGTPQNTADIITLNYGVINSTSRITATMLSRRANHTAVLLTQGPDAGNVLICGGYDGTNTLDSCEIFITSATSSPYFKPGPTMTSRRERHTATLLPNGRIFIAGGLERPNNYHLTTEVYDQVFNAMTPGPSLSVGRADHTSISLANGYTLIIGGYNNNTTSYDSFSKDPIDVIEAQRQFTNGYVDLVEMFDSNGARSPVRISQVDTGQYVGTSELFPYRVSRHSAILLADGSVYIRGGRGNIPVTYLSSDFLAVKGSSMSLSSPEVSVSTGPRRITITSTNIKIKVPDIRLSRYVIGRIIEGDWFISSKSTNTPIAQVSNAYIYIQKTTATLDSVFIGGDYVKGFGWLDKVEVPLQGPGSGAYVVFPPLTSLTSDDGNGSAYLVISNTSLSSGTRVDLLNTTTASITLSFTMPSEYAGANIIGATITLNSAIYRDEFLILEIKRALGAITNVAINSDGRVNVTVNFSTVEGTVENSTTTSLSFPRNISGVFTSLRFDISYTVDRLTFINDTPFSVSGSTIVIRDALFSNNVRYYPKKSEIYMNKRDITGISFVPTFNNTILLTRNNVIKSHGGENCESDPLACTRSSTSFTPINLIFSFFQYSVNDWDFLPPMKEKRAFHTLTVLNNGMLLACGGTNGEKTLDSCEAFDEIKNEWVIVATMTVPRAYHTATLLPNGTVLIAGGTSGLMSNSSALSDAEIFYPDIGKSVKTSPLNKARLLHTATLLPNGNVLFLGGASSTTYLSSAEIFITTANFFIEIGNMNTPRSEHTATLLPNGNVLIIGGINGSGNVLNSCEIFNTNTNTFSNTDSMSVGRKAHSATLLDNGLVVVFGGSNNNQVVNTIEIFNFNMSAGQRWKNFPFFFLAPEDEFLYIGRANHNAVLLPEKSIVYIGGESIYPREVVRSFTEKFIGDDSIMSLFGKTENRIGSASVLTKNNYIVTTGGFDGKNNYLNTVQMLYHTNFLPDQNAVTVSVTRKPFISTATSIVDNNEFLVINSTSANLHSLVEGSGSGSGSKNSDFYKPYIVLTSLNGNYIINLSTMLYETSYNPSWNMTLSTITVRIPQNSAAPYGWYYLNVCNEGICSDAKIIQISTPRPQCVISTPTAISSSVGISSMSWEWRLINISTLSIANGFAVFSSSDIFISTVPFPTPIDSTVTYTLTGLKPNTPSSLKIACYNIGGFSNKKDWAVAVSTIHTRAKPPKDLKVTYASYDTVSLEWDGEDNNPDYTPYQIEISTNNLFNGFSVVINFANNYTDTKATIRNLKPNTRYYFRVKARNGDGIETLYDTQNPISISSYPNVASTITVGNIVGLTGMALSTQSIRWMWNPAGGADGYEIYDYKVIEDPNDPIFKSTIDVSVLIATTPYNYYIWSGLNTNSPYQIKVRSFKYDQISTTTVYGPFAISPVVYTLAATPAPAQPDVFADVTTSSIRVVWNSNGNSLFTSYRLDIGIDENFLESKSFEVDTDSTTFPYVSYEVTNLLPNTRYYFRVFAINKDGIINPEPANLGSKYTLAQSPPWVYVASVSLKGVVLVWETGDNPPYTIYQVRATSVTFESPYVSTPLPFGLGYTGDSYLISGLWLNTSYYFDVTAKNMEGVDTLSIQTATPAYILANFATIPPGAVGSEINTLDKDDSFKGILSDGRNINLTFYKGTFLKPNPFAIASLSSSQLYSMTGSSNPCGYTFGGSTIAFGIYSLEQPYIPVKFTFNYFSSNPNEAYGSTGISSNNSKITLARYNPQTGQCLPVKTEVNTSNFEITAYLNHFSIYQLIMLSPSNSLNNVKVFPNPFYPNRAGQGNITIINLPDDAKLTIYTLSGVKVFETKANSIGTAYWDGRNSKGQYVGSGIYFCLIKSRYGTKTIKVAIER